MGVSKFEVRIEELVLDGFAPGDRFRIGQALERELARLIGEHCAARLAESRTSVAKLDAGSFNMAAGAKAETIGGQVAQSVYGWLAGKVGRR